MSTLVQTVRTMFDLPPVEPAEALRARPPEVAPAAGQILLVTGPSGSGKSHLLSTLRRRHASTMTWIEPTSIRLGDDPVIDTVCGQINPTNPESAVDEALLLLSRVGLAEAWTYLRKPSELSDGQRWRLVLGMMISKARRSNVTAIIAMDEFAALLDRVTAMIVARALRKLVTRDGNVSAIVVTSHEDLFDALHADLHVECDFGAYRVTPARSVVSLSQYAGRGSG